MNPGGPAEEAGKVATSFIESMKGQPLALALCFMNVGLLIIMYILAGVAEKRFDAVIEQQREVSRLLYYCAPLGEGQRYKPQSDESHPYVPTPMPQARPAEAPSQ